MAVPGPGDQQTCCVVFDVDGDGIDDFVIGERKRAPVLVWYRSTGTGWERRVLDPGRLRPEAGGVALDVDRDGDLDLVLGDDASGTGMYWWENPCPHFGQPWKRRPIKAGGGKKHHDQTAGDFDGDGAVELVSWNQRAGKLLLFEIPSDPRTSGLWPSTAIFSWSSGKELEGFPSTPVDIDGDGKLDIVGGGRWFRHLEGTTFEENVIDDAMRFTQCAVGQLIPGGRPEIVFSPGDEDGEARWYSWNGSSWDKHPLRHVRHGHTCEVADLDGDGHLDILIGEMGEPGAGSEAEIWIWHGDGTGKFAVETISVGQGIHEGSLGDLDGDGDLDLLAKPYHHRAPRVDILLNPARSAKPRPKPEPMPKPGESPSEPGWRRHAIGDLPHQATFVESGDLDGDGNVDLAAGAWWWRNPGRLSGTWERRAFGAPLQNLATMADFDADGDLDVLGTKGKGSQANHELVWARNDGRGSFAIVHNVSSGGEGDFLQGCVVADFGSGLQVVLSWHNGGGGLHTLHVPENPSRARWRFSTLSERTEKEDLAVGDIDRDGDLDLLLGTHWLRNDVFAWKPLAIGTVNSGEPDRVDLADVNGDGRLDAVIALENGTDVLWFEAPADPTRRWSRHTIGTIAGQGFSMDTADVDGDGDPDVVVGEHRGKGTQRVVYFENLGAGATWAARTIDSGSPDHIDHHDGTQLADLDGDGDLDVYSIGWSHPRLWIIEQP